jgi:hypothetical protein
LPVALPTARPGLSHPDRVCGFDPCRLPKSSSVLRTRSHYLSSKQIAFCLTECFVTVYLALALSRRPLLLRFSSGSQEIPVRFPQPTLKNHPQSPLLPNENHPQSPLSPACSLRAHTRGLPRGRRRTEPTDRSLAGDKRSPLSGDRTRGASPASPPHPTTPDVSFLADQGGVRGGLAACGPLSGTAVEDRGCPP